MKLHPILSFFLLFCFVTSSAQMTNVRKWRKTEVDSLDNGLLLYDEKLFLQALPIFEDILSHHPKEDFIKYTYAKCAFYRSDKHEEAYKNLSEVYEKNKKVADIHYDMALGALYSNKFEEAFTYLTLYDGLKRRTLEDKKKAELLRKYINNAKYFYSKPTNAKITNLGDAVNSADDEYTPAITADESTLIFTYCGPKSIGGKQNIYLSPDQDGVYTEDIYMSYKLESGFTPAFPLDSLNTNFPDAAISLSNDGRVLFVYKDEGDSHGDIYQSFLSGEFYSAPKKLKGQVNSYSWDGHCSLSPDGKSLYFSSDRSGGHGGRDIYRASLLADSTWGRITNLGDSINTPYDDDSPFIHADGTTLFFSSKGHTSMGGYDIFKSSMNTKDSTFKNCTNLGYPINSTDDDIYFVIAANDNNGYYSSARKGGKGLKDIYFVETNFTGPRPSVYLVKGKTQFDGEGVEAEVKIEITSKNNKIFNAFKSNSNSGAYLVTLPFGANYKFTFSYKNTPPQYLVIDLMASNGYVEKIYDVDFDSVTDTLKTIVSSIAKTQSISAVYKNPPIVKTASVNLVAPKTTSLAVAVTTPTIATKIPSISIAAIPATITESTKPTPTLSASATISKTVTPAVVSTPTLVKSSTVAVAATKTSTVSKTQTVAPIVIAAASSTKTTSVIKTTSLAPSNPIKTTIALKTPTVSQQPTKNITVAKTPTVAVAKVNPDVFVPKTKLQEKAVRYIEKYGDKSAEGLEFKVQIAAFKNGKNYAFPELLKYGRIEKILLGDGLSRLYIGGSFKTLRRAFSLTKKIVNAGHTDAFVSAFYKGKRLTYDELEKKGIFK